MKLREEMEQMEREGDFLVVEGKVVAVFQGMRSVELVAPWLRCPPRDLVVGECWGISSLKCPLHSLFFLRFTETSIFFFPSEGSAVVDFFIFFSPVFADGAGEETAEDTVGEGEGTLVTASESP